VAFPARPGASVPANLEHMEFTSTTGTASWVHKFNDDVNGYLSYGRAHRPGGLTVGNAVALPVALSQFREEISNSIEGGVKGSFFERRLRLNGTVFYQKYKNYINRAGGVAVRDINRPCDTTNAAFTRTFTGSRVDPTGVLPSSYPNTPAGIAAAGLDPRNCLDTATGITFNADALTKGVELEAEYRPIREVTLNWRFAYADAKYTGGSAPCNDPDRNGIAGNQATTATPRQVATGQVAQFCTKKGTKLSGATPPWSTTLTAEYRHPIMGLDWYARAIYQYKPSTTNTDTGTRVQHDDTLNLYSGLSSEMGWEVQAYVKNLTGKQTITRGTTEITSNDLGRSPTGYGSVSFGNGREIGVSLRYRFGGG